MKAGHLKILLLALLALAFALLWKDGPLTPTPGGSRPAAAEPAAGTSGDVNCDGAVNAVDALQVLRYIAGLSAAACLGSAGDVDCSGSIDAVDALLILRYVAGLRTTVPDFCPPIGGGSPPEEEPTAYDLIDEALAQGQIDEEAAILYSVYALFDDPRLPTAYAGAPPPDFESRLDLTLVASQIDSFSETVRAQIEPFLIAPMHAGSWWDLRNNPQAATTVDLSPLSTAPGPILDGDWISIATSNNQVRIWYPVNDFSLFQLANDTKQEIDLHIWPQLVALMGREPLPDGGATTPGRGGDDLTDIVIAPDMPAFITIGLSPNFCERTGAIVLANPGEAARLGVPFKAAIGHELMHVFQFALDRANRLGGNGGCASDEYEWWEEASAVWAEDYLYPSANSEHTGPRGERQVRDFMTDLGSPLDKGGSGRIGGFYVSSSRQYGAYLWAFYAARKFGNDVIGQMWRNMESTGALAAIDSALPQGFEKAWPEFAVFILNQAPYDFFRQQDSVQQSPDAFADQGYGSFATFRHHDEPVKLDSFVGYEQITNEGDFSPDWFGDEHLSMTYNSYLFPDPEVRSVAFYNGMTFSADQVETEAGKLWQPMPRPAEEIRGLTVQALIKYVGQGWQLEDWTYYQYKNFCRDVTAERIEELIIITANSVPERNYQVQSPDNGPKVWVSDMGCNRWQGSVRMEQTDPDGFHLTVEVPELVLERDPSEAGTPCCGGYIVNYLPVGGTLEWQADGMIGQCTVSGSGTAPLQQYHSFATFNYVPEGAYHRAAGGTVATDVEQQYSLDCPDFHDVLPFYPSITFPLSETPVEVFEVGSSFFGTSRVDPVEVTWDLQAVRQ